MSISNRELKWEKQQIEEMEWIYEWKEEQIWLLYENIIYEFKLAEKYYRKNLHKLLYKTYDCRIDYKLLYILNLPKEIQENICKYIYIWCKNISI